MEITGFGNPQSDIVLIQPVDDHDLEGIENEFAEIKRECEKDFFLIAFKVDDWNNDLSPWKAPAVFGKEDFGGGASKTLEELLTLCDDKEKTYYIGGYSLAGLFALTVGDRVREAHKLLKERNVNCMLEWNNGNHFKDPDIRTAKAFAWVMNA